MFDRYCFRGISIGDNEWKYGNVNNCRGGKRGEWFDAFGEPMESGDMVIYNYAEKIDTDDYGVNYKIDKETLGQCVGVKDGYGKYIFEGDVCKYHGLRELVIKWEYGEFYTFSKVTGQPYKSLSSLDLDYLIITGNIYKN